MLTEVTWMHTWNTIVWSVRVFVVWSDFKIKGYK